MEAAKGTKELKDLIDLALAGVEAGVSASKDGHIGLEDLSLIFKLVPLVGPAIDGIGEIPAELASLSEEDGLDLAAHVMAQLAIEDAHAKDVVDKSLKAASAIYALVKSLSPKEEVAPPEPPQAA